MSGGYFATHFLLVVPRPMTFGHLELAKTKCKQMLASKLRKLKFEQKCPAFFFVVSHVPKMGKKTL
jgi:hypothetical protein